MQTCSSQVAHAKQQQHPSGAYNSEITIMFSQNAHFITHDTIGLPGRQSSGKKVAAFCFEIFFYSNVEAKWCGHT